MGFSSQKNVSPSHTICRLFCLFNGDKCELLYKKSLHGMCLASYMRISSWLEDMTFAKWIAAKPKHCDEKQVLYNSAASEEFCTHSTSEYFQTRIKGRPITNDLLKRLWSCQSEAVHVSSFPHLPVSVFMPTQCVSSAKIQTHPHSQNGTRRVCTCSWEIQSLVDSRLTLFLEIVVSG